MNAKESVLDVLMYLFEHYLDEDSDVDADRDTLEVDLMQAGFGETEVVKAFNWLESLASDAAIDIDAERNAMPQGGPSLDAELLDESAAFETVEAVEGWRVHDVEQASRVAEETGEAIVVYSSPALSNVVEPNQGELESLARVGSTLELRAQAPSANAASRIYSSEEMERLGTSCRGFLLFLEQAGVLDPATRERVIDRVMALETADIDLEQLKWVLLMVLFNQPGRESMYAWMEDFVFDHGASIRH